MDVDGTLTDGSMYYGPDGEVIKRFNVKDGMGVVLLRKNGIKTAFLTSEATDIVKTRAERLKIDYRIFGSHNKSGDLMRLIDENGFKTSEIIYVGDDVNDYHLMKSDIYSICPANAVDEIKSVADHVSNIRGGEGIVREVCDAILHAKGIWPILEENW